MRFFCRYILILIVATNAIAQLENKASISVSFGVPFIKSAGSIQAENIYYGYGKVPVLKVGLQYNINHKLGVGPVVGQFYSTKPNYKLTVTSFGLGVKYNIIPFDKKVSPFIYFEGNLNYVTVSQKANSTQENPVQDDKEQIRIKTQTRNYPEIQTGFSSLGAIAGVGIDFTLNKKYTVFVGANYYTTNAAKTYTSRNNFEDNTSKLQFLMAQLGLRFSFGQKKSLY